MPDTRSETITFASFGKKLGAYVARPEGDGPFPGVVVIHEAFGLTDNIRDIANRFAAQGYVAFAVDLFAGQNPVLCMARFMGGMLTNPLGHGGVRDMRVALDTLAARPEVDSGRLGAIGFCMGGSFAVALACTDDRLKAIAPYYGMNPRPLEAVARACPVVGSYPGDDFTAGAGLKLDEALTQAGVPHDIKVYPGTKHSFFNDRSRTYDAAASADSWARVLDFFEEHVLGPGVPNPS